MICPICNSKSSSIYLEKVTDQMVSMETFSLYKCDNCECVITIPVPEDLSGYYDSNQYLSHHSDGNSFLSIIYRNIRKVNINNKINIINSYISGKSILDVGCGTGDFLLAAQQKDFTVSGIEPDGDARKITEAKTGLKVLDDITQLSNSYHAITLWHVLEHMTDPIETLSTLTKQLYQQGIIILALPNYKSFDANYYQGFWAGYDVPRHLFHFSKKTVYHMAQSTGLILEKIHPMRFDAYYVSLLSEKYKEKSWRNYIDAFQTGIRSNRRAQHSGEYSSLIYILRKQ